MTMVKSIILEQITFGGNAGDREIQDTTLDEVFFIPTIHYEWKTKNEKEMMSDLDKEIADWVRFNEGDVLC